MVTDDVFYELDKTFDALWLKPEKLPYNLARWQAELSKVLDNKQWNEQEKEEIKLYLDKWNRVLNENRNLLAYHVEHLKHKLKKSKNPEENNDGTGSNFTCQ